MSFIFKVQPTRTFLDEANIERTVVGINARIVSNIQIKLSPQTDFEFFIEFMLATGTRFGQRNVNTREFAAHAMAQGATQEQADASVSQIMQGLIFGTAQQQYTAAASLANIYGYGLAPIEEQNGNPLAE